MLNIDQSCDRLDSENPDIELPLFYVNLNLNYNKVLLGDSRTVFIRLLIPFTEQNDLYNFEYQVKSLLSKNDKVIK